MEPRERGKTKHAPIAARTIAMLCAQHPSMRNKLNLANARQVRILRKRLGVSEDELRQIAEKVGDSIAGITKEAEIVKMAAAKTEAVTPQCP